jgi:hypothetical protein
VVESYRKKEAMVRQTSDAFRNRITVIGMVSRRIARLAKGPALARYAKMLHREIESLESYLKQFEKYMETWGPGEGQAGMSSEKAFRPKPEGMTGDRIKNLC